MACAAKYCCSRLCSSSLCSTRRSTPPIQFMLLTRAAHTGCTRKLHTHSCVSNYTLPPISTGYNQRIFTGIELRSQNNIGKNSSANFMNNRTLIIINNTHQKNYTYYVYVNQVLNLFSPSLAFSLCRH